VWTECGGWQVTCYSLHIPLFEKYVPPSGCSRGWGDWDCLRSCENVWEWRCQNKNVWSKLSQSGLRSALAMFVYVKTVWWKACSEASADSGETSARRQHNDVQWTETNLYQYHKWQTEILLQSKITLQLVREVRLEVDPPLWVVLEQLIVMSTSQEEFKKN
jgi:hypothetical protein